MGAGGTANWRHQGRCTLSVLVRRSLVLLWKMSSFRFVFFLLVDVGVWMRIENNAIKDAI
jgi:hypothetical protein